MTTNNRVQLKGLILEDGTPLFLAVLDGIRGYDLNTGNWVSLDFAAKECVTRTPVGTFRDHISHVVPEDIDLTVMLPIPMPVLEAYMTQAHPAIVRENYDAVCALISDCAVPVAPVDQRRDQLPGQGNAINLRDLRNGNPMSTQQLPAPGEIGFYRPNPAGTSPMQMISEDESRYTVYATQTGTITQIGKGLWMSFDEMVQSTAALGAGETEIDPFLLPRTIKAQLAAIAEAHRFVASNKKNTRLMLLPSQDGPQYDLHALIPDHMTREEARNVVDSILAKVNAEDAASEDGLCEDGETVQANIERHMEAAGFKFLENDAGNLVTGPLWDRGQIESNDESPSPSPA